MFSLSCAGSFTPVYLSWMPFNPTFYMGQTSADQASQEQSKSYFSPILISSPLKIQDVQDQQPLELQIKATKKIQHIQKCQTQDEEYTPGSGNCKKNKKNQQNQNRNIIPNVVNQILSFIQKRNKSGFVTEKIFDKICSQQNWNVKRFYLYQSMLKNKISHYVNEETLKIYMQNHQIDYSIYCKQEQSFYNKVSRILIKHFMQIQAQTSTLTSKRMDKSKKAQHIKIQRYLMQKLREHYKLH